MELNFWNDFFQILILKKYLYILLNIDYNYYQIVIGEIFMDNDKKTDLCMNEEEANELLQKSRKRIDEIDNDLVNLIDERTALAKDVVKAKKFLGMEIYDKSREDEVHNQVLELAKEKDIDGDILTIIMNMLAMLSKNKQKELLWRENNG